MVPLPPHPWPMLPSQTKPLWPFSTSAATPFPVLRWFSTPEFSKPDLYTYVPTQLRRATLGSSPASQPSVDFIPTMFQPPHSAYLQPSCCQKLLFLRPSTSSSSEDAAQWAFLLFSLLSYYFYFACDLQ